MRTAKSKSPNARRRPTSAGFFMPLRLGRFIVPLANLHNGPVDNVQELQHENSSVELFRRHRFKMAFRRTREIMRCRESKRARIT